MSISTMDIIHSGQAELAKLNLSSDCRTLPGRWSSYPIAGDSIKCWVCRSDGDPLCADPFDNTSFPISDCNKEKPLAHLPGLSSTMCRKVRQKVNGNWRYLRSCAWLGEPGIGRDERYCIHRSGTYNIHVEYCTCR